jgi:hypothetical protein
MAGQTHTTVSAQPSPAVPQHATGIRRRGRHSLPVWLVGIALAIVLTGAAAVRWSSHGRAAVHFTTVPITQGAITRAVTAMGTVCDYNTCAKDRSFGR